MIRSRQALLDVLGAGETVAQLTTFEGPERPMWCVASTGEAVHPVALRAALARDELTTVTADLLGEPMQYGRRGGA